MVSGSGYEQNGRLDDGTNSAAVSLVDTHRARDSRRSADGGQTVLDHSAVLLEEPARSEGALHPSLYKSTDVDC